MRRMLIAGGFAGSCVTLWGYALAQDGGASPYLRAESAASVGGAHVVAPSPTELADRVRRTHESLEYLAFRSVGVFQIEGSEPRPTSVAEAQMAPESLRVRMVLEGGVSESLVMVHRGEAMEYTPRFEREAFARMRRALAAGGASASGRDGPSLLQQQRAPAGVLETVTNLRTGEMSATLYPDPHAGAIGPEPQRFEPGAALIRFRASAPGAVADSYFYDAEGCNFGAQLHTWVGPNGGMGLIFERMATAEVVEPIVRDGRLRYRVAYEIRRGTREPYTAEVEIDAESHLLVAWRQRRPQPDGRAILMSSVYSDHRTTPPPGGVQWMIEHTPGRPLDAPTPEK